MTQAHLDIFLGLFVDAVDHVGPEYMRTLYGDMDNVLHLMQNEAQRRAIDRFVIEDNLVKTGERIFCYELYHQLRLRMSPMADLFNRVYLQGELRKSQIMPLLDRMDLEPLSGNYIPDFLLHTPGSADDHPYVIEVKTDRFLSYPQVTADIKKIVEFLTLYHYQRGIFLSINTSNAFIANHIRANNTLNAIPGIAALAERIYIVNRENEYVSSTCRLLSEFL